MTKKTKKRCLILSALLLLLILLTVELLNKKIFTSEYRDIVYPLTTRAIGGAVCVIFLIAYSFSNALSPKTSLKKFAVFLPCMAIAVNNFPFVSFFSGEAYINGETKKIILYALLCLAVGFFEELAFRACIFSAILERRGSGTLDIFISVVLSSAIFGIVHLTNLITGASVGSVMLQVGYSFLVGGMCSVMLIKTKNIWYCVLLHSLYNFAGGVVPECGGGIIWTTGEIVLTAAVAVPVAVYVIYLLLGIKPDEVDALLGRNTADRAKTVNSDTDINGE